MNDQFRPIVEAASAARPDIEIIDRCNLTVLAEPGHEDLPEFLAKHKVAPLRYAKFGAVRGACAFAECFDKHILHNFLLNFLLTSF